MRRALILATLLVFPALLAGQSTSALRITVTLPGDGQQPVPVSRHVLLISDNPATTVPRRVLTGPAGTVELQLVPGSYTVESDRPATLAGKAYEWTQMIDVVAGRSCDPGTHGRQRECRGGARVERAGGDRDSSRRSVTVVGQMAGESCRGVVAHVENNGISG